MSRLPGESELKFRVVEEALFIGGEAQALIGIEEAFLEQLAAEESRDRLEEAEAAAAVTAIEQKAREARGLLTSIHERNLVRDAARSALMRRYGLFAKDIREASRSLSRDAKAMGVPFMRPELVDCSPSERERR